MCRFINITISVIIASLLTNSIAIASSQTLSFQKEMTGRQISRNRLRDRGLNTRSWGFQIALQMCVVTIGDEAGGKGDFEPPALD